MADAYGESALQAQRLFSLIIHESGLAEVPYRVELDGAASEVPLIALIDPGAWLPFFMYRSDQIALTYFHEPARLWDSVYRCDPDGVEGLTARPPGAKDAPEVPDWVRETYERYPVLEGERIAERYHFCRLSLRQSIAFTPEGTVTLLPPANYYRIEGPLVAGALLPLPDQKMLEAAEFRRLMDDLAPGLGPAAAPAPATPDSPAGRSL